MIADLALAEVCITLFFVFTRTTDPRNCDCLKKEYVKGAGVIIKIIWKFFVSSCKWELSYDIFDRIDVTVAHRSNYVNYMKDNPIIAKRKKVNLKGLI